MVCVIRVVLWWVLVRFFVIGFCVMIVSCCGVVGSFIGVCQVIAPVVCLFFGVWFWYVNLSAPVR